MQAQINMLQREGEETQNVITPLSMFTAWHVHDLRHRSHAGDLESPLSIGLQNQHWPSGFKMMRMVMFEGESDPREFTMSFEAVVESAGEDNTTLVKAFVMTIKG